ncbi:MAG: DUF5719 family protein, partial [Actinomycetota bacterium]|nr:DUF5719 family protein [Actinomycetota bacterium]
DLPPRSRTTLHVNHIMGPDKDVSVSISSERPIICERPMYFLYNGVWSGGHCVTGVGEPSTTWNFAEGSTREGFDEWLCLQNPDALASRADLTFMTGEGEVVPYQVDLPPRSRTTLHVNHIMGPDKDVSVSISSERPIICERPMYFRRWTVF